MQENKHTEITLNQVDTETQHHNNQGENTTAHIHHTNDNITHQEKIRRTLTSQIRTHTSLPIQT